MKIRTLAALPFLVCASAYPWAETVTVTVRDQHGSPIAGSSIRIDGALIHGNGASVTLAPGSHQAEILPGLGGQTQSFALYRTEPFTVLPGQTELTFEWITAALTVDVKDQHGQPIVGSQVRLEGIPGGLQSTPFAFVLPISDPGVYPSLHGRFSESEANGYDVDVIPGLNGQAQSFGLYRSEGYGDAFHPHDPRVQVHAGQTELTFEWITAALTVDVKDQHGQPIAGSQVRLEGIPGGLQSTPFAFVLPISDPGVYPSLHGRFSESEAKGYDVDVIPGLNGQTQPFGLYRSEGYGDAFHPHDPRVQVHAGQTELTFEWITAALTVDVRDQHGQPIAGSQVLIFDVPGPLAPSTPYAVTLPVSDPATYPNLHGPYSENEGRGYGLHVVPGMNGQTQPYHLYRTHGYLATDPPVQVHAGQTELTFEWVTAALTVDVKDQYGESIPGSQVLLFDVPGPPPALTPYAMTLPISDPAMYPNMHGANSENEGRGYGLHVVPGMNGQTQPYHLFRTHGYAAMDPLVQVHAGQTELSLEWIQVECPVQVLSSTGDGVLGSSLLLPFPFDPLTPGETIAFPVTENAVYPGINGSYRDGYPITVRPGDVAPSQGVFEFEVLESGTFLPAVFTVAGNAYSLACQLNRPPEAFAGENLAILSAQQAGTVLLGTGTDPDADSLTYAWREGATYLLGPVVVGPSGGAPLDLGSIPALAVGAHVLTLEVSDGALTASSSLILSVGNTAPSASCSGSGTYQFGVDTVVLEATLADFDGDPVYFQWVEGATIHAAGTALTEPGGGPVAIPSSSLVTGAGPSQLALGTHAISIRYDDGSHEPDECQVVVQVVDTQAPSLAPTSSVLVLWPPDHRMVAVVIQANAHDSSGAPLLLTASISSSEDPRKNGSGQTIPDYTEPIIDPLAGTIAFELRAERAGNGPGRTYTISITATDSAGNCSSSSVQITAPHDKKRT